VIEPVCRAVTERVLKYKKDIYICMNVIVLVEYRPFEGITS